MKEKQRALETLRDMQKRGFCLEFKQEPKRLLDKTFYWFVLYGEGDKTFEEKKEIARRLVRGEKLLRNNTPIKFSSGHGKLLGIIYRKKEQDRQFILYSGTIRSSYDYETYHETWIKLGKWVKKNVEKEKVIFT